MYIAIDFDGTVVKHKYPEIGEDIGAVPVLKALVAKGHKLILHTMRGHTLEGRDTLQEVIDWFEKNGIELYGVNENKSQKRWTTSKKVFANLYIDDSALGAPVMYDNEFNRFIDWKSIEQYFKATDLI